jgi:DNA-directed RNA polymerase specialized sigma24 family protein
MDSKQFEAINKKLDALIRVTGMAACKGLSSDEQARLLHCAGLSLGDIGNLLGSNENAVKQAIHRMKEKSEGGRRAERKGGSSGKKAAEGRK